jgi:metallophosphoesterase (TIGR00282 family)
MKILMIGDIVGSGGRTAFARVAAQYKSKGRADMIVANAENAAGGKGLTHALAHELFAAGADILTLGDHAWDQKELIAAIEHEERILRPANFAPGCPGRGWASCDTEKGRVTVVNLIGRVFMEPYDCPFRAADAILTREPNLGRVILVDLHAEATSEKVAMGRYLDGRVSAVVGTHTHVQTADEKILPKGTAYITDLGMTGPKDSIIGRETQSVMTIFLKGMPAKFEVGVSDVSVEGVLVEVDETTGRARKITRIQERTEPP